MDLVTKAALAPAYTRIKQVADETGEDVINLLLLENHHYATALRLTREALAEVMRRTGHTTSVADPGRVRLSL